MLLRLAAVEKSYGERVLIEPTDWILNAGDKVALVGPNGAGKTTLLQLISGRLEPDRGEVLKRKDLRIGYVEQSEFGPEVSGLQGTVLSQALSVFEELIAMEHRILHLQKEMSEGPDRAHLLSEEYSSLIEGFRLRGGYRFRSQCESVLQGLGFSREALHWPLSHLSGGQQSRLKLARALLSEPDLVLLDEPTNHLDLEAIEWLEDYLRTATPALILVSHDRFFLDQVARQTVELHQRRLRFFSGNFSFYRKERDLLDRQQAAAYGRQQAEIARTEDFIRRNIAGQKTKQAKSRRKMLDKIDRVAALEERESISLRLREAAGARQEVLRTEALAAGYGTTPLLQKVDLVIHRGARIGIVGGNGTGKTTLLRTLLGEVPPLAGKLVKPPDMLWSYFSQTQEHLDPANTILQELHQAAPDSSLGTLRTYLAAFLFKGDDVLKPIEVLSGGEKSRVALAKLLLEPAHVMALDEPTNHLDIPAREVLETAINEFPGTLFVISHDRYFLKQIGTEILLLQDGRIHRFENLEAFERRRQAAGSAAVPAPEIRSQAAQPAPEPGKHTNVSKNIRARQQRALLDLEAKIHRLEAERDKVSEAMQGLEPGDFKKVNELANAYEALDTELAAVYSQWEALMEQDNVP